MGKIVIKDCQVTVAGVDFSDHVAQVELSMKKAGVDTTNMSGGGKEQVAGLSSDEITIDFQQDFALAQVDATLYPLYANENEFTIQVKPTHGAVSTTNPQYSATCILLEYQPLSGKVGDLSTTKVKFPTQRSGISRATS